MTVAPRTPRTNRRARLPRSPISPTQAVRAAVSAVAAYRGLRNNYRGSMLNNVVGTMPSLRRAVSRTGTVTKKRKTNVSNTSDVTGLVKRNLGIIKMYKKIPKHPQTLGRYGYHDISTYVIEGIQGQQITDFTENLFTRDMLVGNTSSTISERFKVPDDLYNLNPFVNRPTSTVFPNAISGVAASDKLYIKSVYVKHCFLSMTILPQEVYVYYLTPRFDTNQNPINFWESILQAKSQGQNNQGPVQDFAANPSPGAQAIQDWGANPFTHVEFRNNWKVVKSSKIVLQAGEQVDLSLTLQYEKIINRNTVNQTRATQFLAGITVFPMMIVRAALEGIKPNTESPATAVAYGKPKVGVMSNYYMHFRALPQSRHDVGRTYTGQVVNTTLPQIIYDDQDMEKDPSDQL